LGSISPFKDSWICLPPRSSVHYAVTRVRSSFIGSTLLDLLARVPGVCGALARLIPGEGDAADRECSFNQNLRKHIETTAPAREEEENQSAAVSSC
jgi:hypothetical protein